MAEKIRKWYTNDYISTVDAALKPAVSRSKWLRLRYRKKNPTEEYASIFYSLINHYVNRYSKENPRSKCRKYPVEFLEEFVSMTVEKMFLVYWWRADENRSPAKYWLRAIHLRWLNYLRDKWKEFSRLNGLVYNIIDEGNNPQGSQGRLNAQRYRRIIGEADDVSTAGRDGAAEFEE